MNHLLESQLLSSELHNNSHFSLKNMTYKLITVKFIESFWAAILFTLRHFFLREISVAKKTRRQNYFTYYFFPALGHTIWHADLSTMTRNLTNALCSGSAES